LLVIVVAFVGCSPIHDIFAKMQIDTEPWDSDVLAEVKKVIETHSKLINDKANSLGEQNEIQTSWQVDDNKDHAEERPRPPGLDGTIGNLVGVMDRLTMENANAVSSAEAMNSDYEGKKADIESRLAVPQQALKTRLEQRRICDQEESAMSQLESIISKAVSREEEIAGMRATQASHYSQMTAAMKHLTEKNQATLGKIISLLSMELTAERDISGSQQFDPVSLRQRQPEDMLRHAKELSSNLGVILDQKLQNQNQALVEISKAFACAECEEKAKRLREILGGIESEFSAKKLECDTMAESHRPLDEADRERTMSLNKELQDLEDANKVRLDAERSLKEQRDQAEHVAKKMVGFYQNLPRVSA
jgi:hypothetical protein